ncbi:hypothetical protein BV378_07655 [Nostoc sp. RF31YmG]|nr:hypothetical protein BV378_07655 [Nostoc sp. RF31YmG]
MSIKRFGLDPDDKLGLSNDDVVSLPNGNFGLERMSKIEHLVQKLEAWSSASNKTGEHTWFLEDGCKCEILRVNGGGWQKGRFRLRLEFIPDNPEAFQQQKELDVWAGQASPLDDLRNGLEV